MGNRSKEDNGLCGEDEKLWILVAARVPGCCQALRTKGFRHSTPRSVAPVTDWQNLILMYGSYNTCYSG